MSVRPRRITYFHPKHEGGSEKDGEKANVLLRGSKGAQQEFFFFKLNKCEGTRERYSLNGHLIQDM